MPIDYEIQQHHQDGKCRVWVCDQCIGTGVTEQEAKADAVRNVEWLADQLTGAVAPVHGGRGEIAREGRPRAESVADEIFMRCAPSLMKDPQARRLAAEVIARDKSDLVDLMREMATGPLYLGTEGMRILIGPMAVRRLRRALLSHGNIELPLQAQTPEAVSTKV